MTPVVLHERAAKPKEHLEGENGWSALYLQDCWEDCWEG